MPRIRHLARVTSLATLLAVLPACSGSPAGTGRPAPATDPSATSSAPSTASSTSAAVPSPGRPPGTGTNPATITLAFAGDVHFENHLSRLLTRPETALTSLRTTLGAADFAMVNLETAITTRGTKVPKAWNFRAPASALQAVASAGVDAVSLANNHGVDYAQVGLTDTLSAKSSGVLPMVGIGRDATEAFTPLIAEVGGVKVAVLASLQLREETATQWAARDDRGGVATNLDMTRLRAATRQAAASADLVVVFMHWGTDYTDCADGWQRRTARTLAEDGADIIVGGHAHRPQGSGWLGSSYVGYGLGNFVWWRHREPDSRSGVLTLTVDAQAARQRSTRTTGSRQAPLVTQARWTPMLVGVDGIPRQPAAAADRQRLQRVWAAASRCAGLRDRP